MEIMKSGGWEEGIQAKILNLLLKQLLLLIMWNKKLCVPKTHVEKVWNMNTSDACF